VRAGAIPRHASSVLRSTSKTPIIPATKAGSCHAQPPTDQQRCEQLRSQARLLKLKPLTSCITVLIAARRQHAASARHPVQGCWRPLVILNTRASRTARARTEQAARGWASDRLGWSSRQVWFGAHDAPRRRHADFDPTSSGHGVGVACTPRAIVCHFNFSAHQRRGDAHATNALGAGNTRKREARGDVVTPTARAGGAVWRDASQAENYL
jgi:hypothetical protein